MAYKKIITLISRIVIVWIVIGRFTMDVHELQKRGYQHLQ